MHFLCRTKVGMSQISSYGGGNIAGEGRQSGISNGLMEGGTQEEEEGEWVFFGLPCHASPPLLFRGHTHRLFYFFLLLNFELSRTTTVCTRVLPTNLDWVVGHPQF